MAQMVFDSSQRKRAERQEALERELAAMKAGTHSDSDTSLPADSTSSTTSTSSVSSDTINISAESGDHPDDLHHDREVGSSPSSQKRRKGRKPEEYSQVLRENGVSGGMFSAFLTQPKGMKFENQHESEKVLLVLRQHPILNLKWIFITIAMIFAPFLLAPILPFSQVFPGVFGFFALVGWYLLTTAYVIESFLHWYFNLYIVTDERIIDVDFYSLIYKEVSEAKLERIEDVTATTAGFLGAIFNYGTIAVQTAAEKRQFEFAAVPHPAMVTKFLNELFLEEELEKMEGRVS